MKTRMKILVVAGIHRDERNAVATAQRLKGLRVSGVIVMPRVTPGRLVSRLYRGHDPNRLWRSGMDYQRAVKEQLRDSQPDLVLDLHSATTGFRNLTHVRYDREALRERFPAVAALVPYAGPVVVDTPAPRGSFRDYCHNVAQLPCLTYEIGSGLVVEKTLVTGAVESVLNLVAQATRGQGRPLAKLRLRNRHWFTAHAGWTLGQRVPQGAVLGSAVVARDAVVVSDRHPLIKPRQANHRRWLQLAEIE